MIRFTTFEGGDGSGKTTQVKALESHLIARGTSCITTHEPGGTSLGRLIRHALLEVGDQPITSPAELFLYLADRAQHTEEIILPALEQGKVVLCDRYTDSTLAYQGYGRGIDLGLLQRLNDIAARGIRPDLTLLFDCPAEVGLARIAQRQSQPANVRSRVDRFEKEKIEFHEKVRNGFLEIAKAEPQRFRIVDAARSAAEVGQAIVAIIDRELS